MLKISACMWLGGNQMLKLAKGYKVTDLTGIEEGFEIRDNYLLANVDADK